MTHIQGAGDEAETTLLLVTPNQVLCKADKHCKYQLVSRVASKGMASFLL